MQQKAVVCSNMQQGLLQQVAVYDTVHPSPQATFTGMTPAMQQ